MNKCVGCGFNDEDYGCTCLHSDRWYACPIENTKPENIQALEECTEFLAEARACGEKERILALNAVGILP